MSKANHLSVRDAQICVLQYVTTQNSEIVKLKHSQGRVLAEEIRAILHQHGLETVRSL